MVHQPARPVVLGLRKIINWLCVWKGAGAMFYGVGLQLPYTHTFATENNNNHSLLICIFYSHVGLPD